MTSTDRIPQRSALPRQDRAGALPWLARLFSAPRIISAAVPASDWDNDVPPFPILVGEVARAERRGSRK